jgi:cobalt-zinc-cadmium efflux system outer membrane protein
MGRSEFPELDLTESLEALPQISLKDFSTILSQRRDAQVASHAVEQAEANARLQRANGRMDPEIQLGYKRTAGFNTLYTAVNVPVALHNRNQGNIASADADVRTAQQSLAAVARQIRAEVESARADYEAKQRVVTDTLRPLLRDAQRSLEITEGAYREGGFDLLRYLDAQRARIEAQTLYYRGLGELHQTAVAVEQAQGDFE